MLDCISLSEDIAYLCMFSQPAEHCIKKLMLTFEWNLLIKVLPIQHQLNFSL